MKNITINFGNIVSELEKGNLSIVFLKNRGIFLEDDKSNLYVIENIHHGSYLDNLIKKSEKVNFLLVPKTTSKNIGEWEKEKWNSLKVKEFINKESKYWL